MKVIVDFDRCEGHGLCVAACAEVFELGDDGTVLVLQEEPPDELEPKVRQAAELCPTAAIGTGRTVSLAEATSVLPRRMLIGGDWIATTGHDDLEVTNPATGQPHPSVPRAGLEEVDRAASSARAVFQQWRWSAAKDRRAMLERLAALMVRDADELATIATLETGLPRTQTPFMVQYGIEWLRDCSEWPAKATGAMLPVDRDGGLTYSILEPLGVVANITTWNGSVGAFAMSVAPALAAGCCVIVKPSELAPYGALKMAELCVETGLPPGVLSVVLGGSEIGDALVRHPDVDKVSFTGGYRAAKAISRACSEGLKPCLLELGGKSASLVFDDASMATAIGQAMGLTFNAGQTCTVSSRLLVQTKIYDQFVEALTAGFESIVVGDPFEPTTSMGPVISETAGSHILGMVDRSRAVSRLVTGGTRLPAPGPGLDGCYVAPTLFADVPTSSELARDEVFGPVGAILRFEDEDEAVALANDSAFGLAAYVHTQDMPRALRVIAALDSENVGVNGGTAPAGPSTPFGGRKQSGYGKQGGFAGYLEFTRTKTVAIRQPLTPEA